MRGNSLAYKNPRFRPTIIEKSPISTRPPTRGFSYQPRPAKGQQKQKQSELRLKKCPNCGSSFNPSQYSSHFRCCFRYNMQEQDKKHFSKTTKQSFRIKKMKGNKDELVQKRNNEKQVNMEVQKNKKKLEKQKEEQKVQSSSSKNQHSIQNPEIEVEKEQILNEQRMEENQEQNQSRLLDSMEIQQNQVHSIPVPIHPARPRQNHRPPTPYPQPIVDSVSQPRNQTNLQLGTFLQFQSRQNNSNGASHSQSAQNRSEPSEQNQTEQTRLQSFRQMVQQIGVNEISALINRLPFLRENVVVQQRLRSLVNFIGIINLMIPNDERFSMSAYPGIKNILRNLVEELTQVLTMIVSTRLGLILMMAPQGEPENKGFTQSQIQRLFVPQIHTTGMETCTVCLNDFVKFERTVNLKCKHEFHINCITEWLLKNSKCPICRLDQKQ